MYIYIYIYHIQIPLPITPGGSPHPFFYQEMKEKNKLPRKTVSLTEKYMSSLEKYTHTKTAFSNMVGSFFPRKTQVLFRLKVHCADIAEKIFNFLTSKSWFSRGYISVIISCKDIAYL